MDFVRVYVEGVNEPAGAFMTRADEIAGLTPKQIQQRLALPQVPTHLVDDLVPEGTKMQVGRVAAQSDFGVSVDGGIQYQLMDEILNNAFSNKRSLQ
jgi:filamentous hemagglutinin